MDISGVYGQQPVEGDESLLTLLLGADLRGGATTRLIAGASSLQIDSPPVHRLLHMPEDYRCEADGAIALTRRDTARISLPPLINQQVTRSYVLRRDASGELILSVFSQTVASPYGVRLAGPVQLDKTIRWKRQAGS